MTSPLTSPIPIIPITGWLPEPVDWVTVVAIYAAILLELGDESRLYRIIQLEGQLYVSQWGCS